MKQKRSFSHLEPYRAAHRHLRSEGWLLHSFDNPGHGNPSSVILSLSHFQVSVTVLNNLFLKGHGYYL